MKTWWWCDHAIATNLLEIWRSERCCVPPGVGLLLARFSDVERHRLHGGLLQSPTRTVSVLAVISANPSERFPLLMR